MFYEPASLRSLLSLAFRGGLLFRRRRSSNGEPVKPGKIQAATSVSAIGGLADGRSGHRLLTVAVKPPLSSAAEGRGSSSAGGVAMPVKPAIRDKCDPLAMGYQPGRMPAARLSAKPPSHCPICPSDI